MNDLSIPLLSNGETTAGFSNAAMSKRRRHGHILHKQGDLFNRVFSFAMIDSYMQPHLHPGEESCEDIYLVKGTLGILYFDNSGNIMEKFCLEEKCLTHVRVPSKMWHTYIMLTDQVLTYETMDGLYDPATWKIVAPWAPKEGGLEAVEYLMNLKSKFNIQQR
jgi:cupin fold WbuC family metalloprotein